MRGDPGYRYTGLHQQTRRDAEMRGRAGTGASKDAATIGNIAYADDSMVMAYAP